MPKDDQPDWVQQHRWDVGARIRTLRRERGLTQEQLGDRCGLDNKTISRAENGVHSINIDLVAHIAKALDVPSWRLFRDD